MGKYSFLNLHDVHTLDLAQALSGFQKLTKCWKNTHFRLDRLILNDFKIANNFLSSISNYWEYPSKLTISLDNTFSLKTIFNNIEPPKTPIMCEILTSNDLEHIETLNMFLNDFFPEIQDFIFPKCSLVNPTYQMDYNSGKITQRIKRLKRPSRWFQEKLKKILPEIYPSSLGKEYYGNPVFTTYKNLFINQVQKLKKNNRQLYEKLIENPFQSTNLGESISRSSNNNQITQNQQEEIIFQQEVENLPDLPYPPRTMISSDFRNQINQVEFKFQHYLNIDKLSAIQAIIEQLVNENVNICEKIQFRFIYDAWETDLFHRTASQDVIILTQNNPELALKERNWEPILQKNNTPMWSIYFQLTSMIKNDDFRLEEFQKVWKDIAIFLR